MSNIILDYLRQARNRRYTWNADAGEFVRESTPGAEYTTVYATGSGAPAAPTLLATVTTGKKALVTMIMVAITVSDDFTLKEGGDGAGGGTNRLIIKSEQFVRAAGATGGVFIATGSERDPVLELDEGRVDVSSEGNDTFHVTMTYVEVDDTPA